MKYEDEWKFIFEIVIAFFYTCLSPFTMMILLGKVFFLLSLEKIKFALKIKSKIINES